MTKLNPTNTDPRLDATARVAGGHGAKAARQSVEALLRRATLATMLFEDKAYESGDANAKQVAALIAQLPGKTVAALAIEARKMQGLRHMPVFMLREMCRHRAMLPDVADTLAAICTRPDMLTDFVALYKRDGKGLPAQAKKGMAQALNTFDAYQLRKWDADGAVKLRDVLRMAHPTPKDAAQSMLFKQLDKGTLPDIVTWERAVSGRGNRREVWEMLLDGNNVPALAFLRNLGNMQKVGLPRERIVAGLERLASEYLLPLTFLGAQRAAPDFVREIEACMFRCYARAPKLKGHTVFVVDVSGSMGSRIAARAKFTRLDAALAMAMLATERSESVQVVATAGSDAKRGHKTVKVKPYRGFALVDEVIRLTPGLGGGGIFTRQCMEWLRAEIKGTPTRIVVFSDSQDCDPSKVLPKPFAKYNYIVDVSSHSRGINYDGVWTAEVSGWSEKFLDYIVALETEASV